MSQTVAIGRDPDAPYLAFGDDSKFGDVLAFAFVVIQRRDVERMIKRLLKVKRRLGIPENYVLHCRELFHYHPREKAGIGHLSDQKAKSVVGHLIHEINVLECWVRYAFCRAREGEPLLAPDDQIPAVDNDKGMMAMLAQACLLPSMDRADGPNADRCEVYVAEEATKIQFLGKGKTRADRWASGYSDVGAAPGSVFRLQPHLIPISGHPLMQIADVLAYACSHALSEDPKAPFFREQFSRIRRYTQSEFLAPDLEPKANCQDAVNRIAAAISGKSDS